VEHAIVAAMADRIHLPDGYTYEWAGEYESLQKELRHLAIVIPLSLLIIASLLYMLFNSARDAGLVMAVLPFGIVGGVLTLLITKTPFSISAAVGFASALGVGTLGASVFLSGIRRVGREGLWETDAILTGALEEMRPVTVACLAAGLGLLPAAISTGIGAQAQQPLARVVVGGMLTSLIAILFLLPIFASYVRRSPEAKPE
jgi:cobalt-zinc-cadmium resistance protein CzcA